MVTSFTHIILDEIHERSADADFTLLLARIFASEYPNIKVILMSATMQSDLFINYFQETLGHDQVAGPYSVGKKRFFINVHFLDELHDLPINEMNLWNKEEQHKAASNLKTKLSELSEDPDLLSEPFVSSFAKQVCTELIISQANLGKSIIVFLPGFSDISGYYKELSGQLYRRHLKRYFSIFVFHSQVPCEEQTEAFEPPPWNKAYVILSSRMAESSFTFPNLEMVINFGFSRVCEYQLDKRISRLVTKWCSRAACAQRIGRVGRVSEGTAIHLFTRRKYECLNDFDPPEILISPLAKHLLRVKDIAKQLHIPSPSELLRMLIEPPSVLQMEAALTDLVEVGAVKYNPAKGISEDADTTLLGKFSLALPLDLKLSKMVLLGIFFGCPLDAIIMAAALSLRRDVFSLPTQMIIKDMDEFCGQLKRSTESRIMFDAGLHSNPIMNRNLFIKWLEFRNNYDRDTIRHEYRAILARKFARIYSVGAQRLLNFEKSVCEIASGVLKFVPNGIHLYTELETLAAVNTYGAGRPEYFVPGASNVCNFNSSTTLYFCSDHNILKMLIIATSPADILYGERQLESSDATERKRATATLQAINDLECDLASTIAMDLRRDTDSDSDTELAFEESSTDEESNISEVDSEPDEALEGNKSYGNYICMPFGPVCVSDSTNSEESNSSDESVTEEIIQSLMKTVPVANCTCTKIVENIAVVQFMKLYSKMCVESTMGRESLGEFAGQSVLGSSEISEEVKFFWQFTERRKIWQVEGIDAELPSPFHPCALTWHRLTVVAEYVNTVFFGGWRNPTAFVCKLQQPTKPFFAVASDLLGTRNPFYMFATSITILPQVPSALLMMLSFQPFSSKLELLTDSNRCRFITAKLNSREIECTDSHFSKEDVIRLNRLRKAVSHALACFDEKDPSVTSPVIRKVPHLLQDVLRQRTNGTEVNGDVSYRELSTHGNASPSSIHQESSYKHQESSTALVWEAVTPGYDHYDAQKVAGQVEYYPQLHCSFAGCTPTEDELGALTWDVHHAETSHEITESRWKQPQAVQKQPQAVQKQPQAGRKQPQAGRKQPQAGRKWPQTGQKQPQAGQNHLPPEHEWVTWFEQPDEDGEEEYRGEEYDLSYKLCSGNFTCKTCNKHFEEQHYNDHHRKCSLCNVSACIKVLRKHEFRHTYSSVDVPRFSYFSHSIPSKSVTYGRLQNMSKQISRNTGHHRTCKKWNFIACRRIHRKPHCTISSGRNYAVENVGSGKQSCEPCSRKGFKSQRSYQAHLKSHKKCDICGLEACPKVLAEHKLAHAEPLEPDEAESNKLSHPPVCEPLAVSSVSKPSHFQPHVQPQETTYQENTAGTNAISSTDLALAGATNHAHSEGDAIAAVTDVAHEKEETQNDTESGSTSDPQDQSSSQNVQQPSHKYKPGSEMHMVEYFKDYIQENGGEVSITGLRKIAFQNYRKRYKGCPILDKNVFISHPQDFMVVEGAGFCTIKLEKCATAVENLVIPITESSLSTCCPDTSSRSDDQMKGDLVPKQGPTESIQQDAVVCSPIFLECDVMRKSLDFAYKERTVPKAAAMLLGDPDLKSCHHSDPMKMNNGNVDSPSITADRPSLPRSESEHQDIPAYNLPDHDPLLTDIVPSAPDVAYTAESGVVVKISTSKEQPPLAVGPPVEGVQDNTQDDSTPDYQSRVQQPLDDHKAAPGSDMHLMMYLKDYMKNNGGEASVTSLQRIPFQSYHEKFSGPMYLSKNLFKSYPEDFKVVEGAGFCRIKLLHLVTRGEEGPTSNPSNSHGASIPGEGDEASGVISSIRDISAQLEKGKLKDASTTWITMPATVSKMHESGPSIDNSTDVMATEQSSVEVHEDSTTVTIVKQVVPTKQVQLQSSAENETSTKHTQHQQHTPPHQSATTESGCESSDLTEKGTCTTTETKGTSDEANVHFVSGVKFVDGNEDTKKDASVAAKGSEQDHIVGVEHFPSIAADCSGPTHSSHLSQLKSMGQKACTARIVNVNSDGSISNAQRETLRLDTSLESQVPGSTEHIVKYFKEYLSAHGDGCHVDELMEVFDLKYKQEYALQSQPSKAKVNKEFFRTHSDVFTVSRRGIVRLIEKIAVSQQTDMLQLPWSKSGFFRSPQPLNPPSGLPNRGLRKANDSLWPLESRSVPKSALPKVEDVTSPLNPETDLPMRGVPKDIWLPKCRNSLPKTVSPRANQVSKSSTKFGDESPKSRSSPNANGVSQTKSVSLKVAQLPNSKTGLPKADDALQPLTRKTKSDLPQLKHASQPQQSKSVQPQQSKSVQPQQPKSVQPQQSKSVQPQQSKSVQPQQSKSVQPQQSKSVQPEQSKSVQSKSVQPQQSKSVQPQQSKSVQPQQSKSVQPQQSKSVQPQQSKSVQPEQSKSVQSKSVQPQQSKSVQPQQSKSVQPQQSKSVQPQQSKSVQPEQSKSVQSKSVQSKSVQPQQSKSVQPQQSKSVQPQQSKSVQPQQSKSVQPQQSKSVQPQQSKSVQPEQSKSVQSKSVQPQQSKSVQPQQSKSVQPQQSKSVQPQQSKSVQPQQSKSVQPQQSKSVQPQQSKSVQPQQSKSVQPQQSKSVQPQQSKSVQPQQSKSVQPQQSKSVQPQQSKSVQPQQSKSVQPQQSKSVQPQQSKSVQPQQSKSVQPQQTKSVQPQQSKSVQPQQSKSVQPQQSKSVQPQQSKSVQPQSVQPQQSKSVQPQQSKSVQPQQSKSVQPQQSKSVQPQQSKSVQPQQSKSVQPQQSKSVQPQQSKSAHDVQHSALSQVTLRHHERHKIDPFTPQHVAEYFSNHLSRVGECSVEELKEIFARKYMGQYVMCPSAVITFVSEKFFRRRSDLFEVTTNGTVKLKKSAVGYTTKK